MLSDLFSKPYSKLYIVGDNADWAIDEEVKALNKLGEVLGYKTKVIKKMWWNSPQIVHYASQFSLLDEKIYKSSNRISIDYFHGKPKDGDSYRKCFEMISKYKDRIFRIRVSHKSMKEALVVTGIDSNKVVVIPIGQEVDLFPIQTEESKKRSREDLGIDLNATVVGSFQKDGVGWGDGNEPKFIKGPDIFLKVIEKLKADVPNLFVLLSGPSRGFVKTGLDKIGVPYKHVYLDEYRGISGLYDALDLYLITSREEGGPKTCLESMSKGIPLVTTEVGQCQDLVVSGQNAMMTNVENVQELFEFSKTVLSNDALKKSLVANALHTANENSYTSQTNHWRKYFQPRS